MQRDQFEIDVRGVEWVDTDGEPRKPVAVVAFHGSRDDLRNRLTGTAGETLSADQTDVSFRFVSDSEDAAATGVVAVTNRLTGDFVLETNAAASDVLDFVRAARRYGEAAGDDGRYRITITTDGEELASYEKSTLLVYTDEGELLRNRSLIPSGVEL
ncbi:MAG: DUF5793 family protein [Halobacteriaceae archaeon]